MKFSTLTIFDNYPNRLSRTPKQFYNEVLEQAVRAEEVNFDGVWFAEHHFSDFGINPSPAVLLAAVSQRTNRIRLGVGVSVLPLHNPIRVAEDYAMVDLLSNGRLDLGLGSGYAQKEFDGYNISLEDKTERFNESLEVLRKAWSGKIFSHQGNFFNTKTLGLMFSQHKLRFRLIGLQPLVKKVLIMLLVWETISWGLGLVNHEMN